MSRWTGPAATRWVSQAKESSPQAFVAFDDSLDEVAGLDAGPPLLATAAEPVGVLGGFEQRPAQGAGIAGWDEPAGAAGYDEVLGPFDGGGDDRAAGGHRLEDYVRHPLPERREDQDVGGP